MWIFILLCPVELQLQHPKKWDVNIPKLQKGHTNAVQRSFHWQLKFVHIIFRNAIIPSIKPNKNLNFDTTF